jgi:hypothetical protein
MRKAQEVCPAPSSEGYVKLLGRTILFYEEQSEGFDIFVYMCGAQQETKASDYKKLIRKDNAT